MYVSKLPDECRSDEIQIVENRYMSILDSLRKGLGFLLMSMGVSSPAKKAKPAPKPTSKPESRQ